MDTRPNREHEASPIKKSAKNPPRLLERLFERFTPQGPATGKSILTNLWKQHPSVIWVLLRIPIVLAQAIYGGARDGFYWKMVVMQACILLITFADVLSPMVMLILALTFASMLLREAYVRPKERLPWELVTVFMAPVLVFVFGIVLGLAAPGQMLPTDVLAAHAVRLAFPIAFLRYNYAREAGPEHPYKDLLQAYHRVWFFSYLWMACAVAFLMSLEQAAPAITNLQPFLTISPGVTLFAAAVRLQLNPLQGMQSRRLVQLFLFTDPYKQDIRLKRHYLLTGADWFRNFNLQSLYEILGFLFPSAWFVIALWQWYAGDANAARINWPQMAADGAAWIGLMVTWRYVKQMNREVAEPFDEAIQTF
jgi:hypothetical protein